MYEVLTISSATMAASFLLLVIFDSASIKRMTRIAEAAEARNRLYQKEIDIRNARFSWEKLRAADGKLAEITKKMNDFSKISSAEPAIAPGTETIQ